VEALTAAHVREISNAAKRLPQKPDREKATGES